ncbi:MAG: sialate O-acetylesterase [Bacteroidales bacterium]
MKKIFLYLLLLPLSIGGLNAKIKLPTILADNMVLQQESLVSIWGEATPNKKITVFSNWDQKKYTTLSKEDGSWILKIKTPAAGGPYELNISDGELLKLSNILIGEVWFCSGQSNMEMPIKGFKYSPVEGANDLVLKAKPSLPIRIYTAQRSYSKKPQTDCKGSWQINDSEGVSSASATAYFFAKCLQEVLDVPVGIVVSSHGASKMEAWMSESSLKPFKNEVSMEHLYNEDTLALPYLKACMLGNAMMDPFLNFKIKGMIWYQGEADVSTPQLYHQLMKTFVSDIRDSFGQREFPFYYVQIAPYRYKGESLRESALLREVQMQCMAEIPNSGMVVTTDIAGRANNIHPSQKKEVGERLAYWALSKTYGKKDISYSGPIYKSMEIKDGKAYITFDHEALGLAPFEVELKGFEIAGQDQIFYPAKAMVIRKENGRLVVSSDLVQAPVAVRYCFRNYEIGNLINTMGLPASPFRTDHWPIEQ